jgi:pimeloyl-ACP methyl ester carboxylesterase
VATFVLVHGAWHGGWCWQRLTPLLRSSGHHVYTPTLTGLGERAHLLSPQVDLQTHAQDVAGVLQYEALHHVLLVGHSYGGMVITAAAELVAGRLAHLIYLDAYAPLDGECLLDFLPPDARERTLARARAEGDGWYLPPQRDEHPYGIRDPADVAWLRSKLTAHPLKSMTQPVRCADPVAAALPRTYVTCTATGYFPFFARRAQATPGWAYRELDAVLDAMVATPHLLAGTLLDIAATATCHLAYPARTQWARRGARAAYRPAAPCR